MASVFRAGDRAGLNQEGTKMKKFLLAGVAFAALTGSMDVTEIERIYPSPMRVTDMAPADLEATIQSMKRVAMRRMDPNAKELPLLNLGDLDEALGRVQPRF